MIQRAALSLLIPLILWPTAIIAQTTADPDLLAEINKIKAIDNHAHPLRYVSAGEKPDDEFDALPLDNLDPIPLAHQTKSDEP